MMPILSICTPIKHCEHTRPCVCANDRPDGALDEIGIGKVAAYLSGQRRRAVGIVAVSDEDCSSQSGFQPASRCARSSRIACLCPRGFFATWRCPCPSTWRSGLMLKTLPMAAEAAETLPPCRRWSKVSTVNQWQTFSRCASTHSANSSMVTPSACLRAASRTRKPSPAEAQRVSTTMIRLSG